jgi:hypothetical protein
MSYVARRKEILSIQSATISISWGIVMMVPPMLRQPAYSFSLKCGRQVQRPSHQNQGDLWKWILYHVLQMVTETNHIHMPSCIASLVK